MALSRILGIFLTEQNFKFKKSTYVRRIMSVAFSSDGSDVVNRHIDIQREEKHKDDDLIEWQYDIDATVKWIGQGSFSRIALQFPDHLLPDSVRVLQTLERKANRDDRKLCIMADTSYGSCCIDEITAQHVNADCIIHYGDACLSKPTQNIPVFYVFHKLSFQIDHFQQQLPDCLSHFDKQLPIVVLYELSFWHAATQIMSSLSRYANDYKFYEASPVVPQSEGTELCSLGRTLKLEICSYSLLFVGASDSALLQLWLMTHPSCVTAIVCNPSDQSVTIEKQNINRLLMKRLYLVEKVKDARTIGIVAGTVGVKGHQEAVDRIKSLCTNANKKFYTFSVGKLNSAKLANFADHIDVFVLVSCPYGLLLDTSEYYRPIVSVFELEVALNPEKQWNSGGGWTAEFGSIITAPLPEHKMEVEPDVSLVTGQIRSGQTLETGSNAVQLYTAGDYYQNRSWKGLDDSCSDTKVEKAVEGRTGIAAGYENEQENQ